MAHTNDDDESKVLAGIKMLAEGEMKEKLLETFSQIRHKDLGNTSKGNISKALFVDASYDKSTKSFQRNQQHTKPRSLTLGEVSDEIHHLRKEIVELKIKISQIEKGKWQEPTKNPNVKILKICKIVAQGLVIWRS